VTRSRNALVETLVALLANLTVCIIFEVISLLSTKLKELLLILLQIWQQFLLYSSFQNGCRLSLNIDSDWKSVALQNDAWFWEYPTVTWSQILRIWRIVQFIRSLFVSDIFRAARCNYRAEVQIFSAELPQVTLQVRISDYIWWFLFDLAQETQTGQYIWDQNNTSTSSSLGIVTSMSCLVGYADVFHCMFDVSFADRTESSMIDRPWLLCPKVCFLRQTDETRQATAALAYRTKCFPPSLL
jgi:hypothetical protein